jgi:hypothetical protein
VVDIPPGGDGIVLEGDVSAIRDANLRRGRLAMHASVRVVATDGR